jgi:hypothetical protein
MFPPVLLRFHRVLAQICDAHRQPAFEVEL